MKIYQLDSNPTRIKKLKEHIDASEVSVVSKVHNKPGFSNNYNITRLQEDIINRLDVVFKNMISNIDSVLLMNIDLVSKYKGTLMNQMRFTS